MIVLVTGIPTAIINALPVGICAESVGGECLLDSSVLVSMVVVSQCGNPIRLGWIITTTVSDLLEHWA
jgi:hypothetical protein